MSEDYDEDDDRVVHARLPYVDDKEIHISTVRDPEYTPFIDFREYIPSLKDYGRGLTIPLWMLEGFQEGVHEAWAAHGSGDFSGELGDPSQKGY
jgi:hypothetical protein